MKSIIRMNQLAGLITESQATEMLKVLNEVTYSKREIITSVTFSNGEKFEVGEYSNYDDMRVTAIRPVPENEREEDEVVSIEMKGSDGKATYYFNENGEQVEE